ncbi:anti-sigma-D factor RsdA [Nocardia sp. NPDC004722]
MARDGERGRGDFKARPGSQNSGPYAEASGDTGPVDIAAVRRDDALIDAISGDGPVQTGTSEEYQLAALLADWRAEIMAEPLPAGPDLDAIVAAVNQEIGARQARIGASNRGRLRLVRPLLGAAAAMALVIGGLTAFSYNASPGDPLWKVKEVVFSEQAQSTVVSRADDSLAQAQQLLAENKPEEAQKALAKAADNANQVNDSGKKDDLNGRWQQLFGVLAAKAPELAAPLTTLMPTPTKVPVTTTVPVEPTAPVTAPKPDGSTAPSIDPSVLGTNPNPNPNPNPSSGGGVSTLPTAPPVTTIPAQPSSEPTEPVTPPTGGPGNTTTVVVVPTAGNTGGGAPTGAPTQAQPTIEKPIPNPVVPTTIAIPTVPLVPGPGVH